MLRSSFVVDVRILLALSVGDVEVMGLWQRRFEVEIERSNGELEGDKLVGELVA
jgi:hypothetical protein